MNEITPEIQIVSGDLCLNESVISKIIRTNLIEDFLSNNRSGLYSATQKMMAYNSNRLEGSTLTSEQTASLFDTGTLTSNGIEVYRAKDIEEMNGHFKMFDEMLKHIREPLSIEMIKSYHYQLKSGVFEDMLNGYPVGEFKNRANIVSDIKTTKPAEVQLQLENLLEKYNSSNKTLENIAHFHAEYEKIHPFQDGNGRTGRMIMVKQCFEANLVPIIVKDNDKLLYSHALHAAQTENRFEPLIDFLAKSRHEYFCSIQDFVYDFLPSLERKRDKNINR